MDAPGIEVRPIPCMLGPHHLNEVFLDDVWVTRADVLGEVDKGWSVVQEVLAFERVGIARYARVERLLGWAPDALGDAWGRLPGELRSRWARMLVHARRARLLAYRVIATQQTGQVRPGDTAAYRIAVTRLDQESAEVLMDIAAELPPADSSSDGERFRRAVEDHHRYSVSATVASGSIEMQRILLARALLAAA
jgi:alkylation response protein AidB-like acyl-CoA dehydrogenase